MALKNNTWKLNQWYDQDVAGNVSYSAPGGDAGELYTWGNNSTGQLADNSQTQRSSPVQVPGTTWLQLGDGTGYSKNPLAIKSDGTLWAWGADYYGSLGNNTTAQYSSPVQVPGNTWAYVSCGQQSNAATKTDGTLWVWGDNDYGQLSQNNRTRYSSPTQIGSATNWVATVAGFETPNMGIRG